MITPELLEILACPFCGGDLRAEIERLVCTRCGPSFRLDREKGYADLRVPNARLPLGVKGYEELLPVDRWV